MPKVPHRQRPKFASRLPVKLLTIRNALNESQGSILKTLSLADDFTRDYVSKWERGVLEPPLIVINSYAELANVWLEVLIKDELDLPDILPAKVKSEGIAKSKSNNRS